MRYIWLTLLSVIFGAISGPAQAQFEDLGGILEDILGGQIPGQTPIYGDAGIESIPIVIRYDTEIDYTGHMLIATAYVPNDPNGGRAKPQILGQTRLLLTGLTQPLQITIPVPKPVTQDLTFSRITAEIIDSNTNQVLINERDGLYRGAEPPTLILRPVGARSTTPSQPNYIGFETIKGRVKLSGRNPALRGGKLTIQLLENALAGGTSVTIAAENVISIDNLSPPFNFTLDRGIPERGADIPLAFKAWISDWAGRKTHVIRRPVAYNGPDIDYTLTLDALVQGADTQRGRNLDPNLMAQAIISGEAVFDANRGLPSDARLKITLKKAVGAMGENRLLATQTILLSGLSGNAPFALSTASTNFDPLIPAPHLNLQIVDRNDRVYFESGDISAQEGPQTIRLYPRSNR